MFNSLFLLIKSEFALSHIQDISGHIGEILSLFSADYMNDKNAKNAAIDAVIEILQQHKDK